MTVPQAQDGQPAREAVARPAATPPAAAVDNDGLLARRDHLKMRSELLRQRLALRAEGARPVFNAADRVADGVRWVKHNPALLALAAAALVGAVAARPRAFVRLGTRAFAAWQMFQRVQPVVRTLLRRR